MEDLTKKQQEERTRRRRVITKAWSESADARTFIAALEKEGYYIARGDNHSNVVVDLSKDVHSLTRQIDGVKAKEIKARLAALPAEELPDTQAVRDRTNQHINERRCLLDEQNCEAKRSMLALAPYALLIVSVLLAYANIYRNTFLYDDYPAIVFNNSLRHWSNLPDLLTGLISLGYGRTMGIHRPLLMPLSHFMA
jgi:hypothetical protein